MPDKVALSTAQWTPWLEAALDEPMHAGMPSGLVIKYSDDQPRDDAGRWTDGGGGELSNSDFRAMRGYAEDHYKAINGSLRGDSKWRQQWSATRFAAPPTSATIRAETKTIDRLMSSTTRSLTVYRGTNQLGPFTAKDILRSPGSVVSDKAFVSTAAVKSSAFEQSIVMRIHVPEGSRAIDMNSLLAPKELGGVVSLHPKEREVLLDRGTNFRIDRVTPVDRSGMGDVYYQVDATVVP